MLFFISPWLPMAARLLIRLKDKVLLAPLRISVRSSDMICCTCWGDMAPHAHCCNKYVATVDSFLESSEAFNLCLTPPPFLPMAPISVPSNSKISKHRILKDDMGMSCDEPIRLQTSSLNPVCVQFVSSFCPVCVRFVSGLCPVCVRFVSGFKCTS